MTAEPIEAELEEIQEPPRHIPSGRVNLFAFCPLLIGGCLLAVVMAFVLLMAESGFYYYFITPLLVGLPVLGATWAIVRLGKCRNRGLAGLVGIMLAFVYYAGYWELSYVGNIVANGPRAMAAVRKVGGMPGLPGYIVFRCKTSRALDAARQGPGPAGPPTTFDAIFNAMAFGFETLMIAGICIGIGRSAASGAFSERYRRWLSSFAFRVPAATAPVVVEAIESGRWKSLAELPRVSSAGNANTNSLLFKLEYLPGVSDEPAYVTLIGNAGGHDGHLT